MPTGLAEVDRGAMIAKTLSKTICSFWFCFAAIMLVYCTHPITAGKSSKNGAPWRKVSDLPAGDNRYTLYFINEQEGWLASGKKLWRTIDGGRNPIY